MVDHGKCLFINKLFEKSLELGLLCLGTVGAGERPQR